MQNRIGGVVVAGVALVSMAVTCGGDPSLILQESVDAMREIDSFHFEEWFSSGVDFEELDRDRSFQASGGFQSPDRIRKRARFQEYSTDDVHVQAIGIGDARYLTDPGTERWAHVDTADYSTWHLQYLWRRPIEFMEGVVSLLGPDMSMDVTTVDGIDLYHITDRTFRYEYPAKAIDSETEFWVGADDLLVRKIRMTRHLTTGCPPGPDVVCPGILYDPSKSSTGFRFTDFGKEVSIRTPSVEETDQS